MDHTQAIRRECAEKYLLGELDEEERLEFEEHFFGCRECAEDVKTAVAFANNAREVFSKEPPDANVLPFEPRRSRPFRPSQPWRALAAAALLLVVCGALYQAVVVVPDLRRELASTQSPQAVRWEFLSVSRSSIPVVKVASRHQLLGLRLSKSSEATYADYLCELRDADDQPIQSALLPAPPPGEELGLVLPLSGLQPGVYVLVLSGLDTPHGPVVAPELARYRFTLELE